MTPPPSTAAQFAEVPKWNTELAPLQLLRTSSGFEISLHRELAHYFGLEVPRTGGMAYCLGLEVSPHREERHTNCLLTLRCRLGINGCQSSLNAILALALLMFDCLV